jgi:tetratricopeptide (TPR) repeat protein
LKCAAWVLSLFVLLPACPLPAAELEVSEPGVVDVPVAASNTDENAWKPVEDARGSTRFAAVLEAWLAAHPHGPQAARGLIERAALQENLLEAGADLRRARGEGPATPWGARASLELAKLEYDQERSESALVTLEEAETWPRGEDLEPDWLYWHGQCRLVLKGFERAKVDFERLIASYPKYGRITEARLGLAECDAALARDDKALGDKALAEFEAIYRELQSPYGAQALWGAAALCQRQERIAEAKRLFTRIRTQYPASFESNAAQDRLEQLAKAPAPTPTPAAARLKPGSFYVQVGAFSKRGGALNLQKILKKRRYPVLLQVRKFGARTLYIVKVGPLKSRAVAESMAHKLETRDKLLYRINEE